VASCLSAYQIAVSLRGTAHSIVEVHTSDQHQVSRGRSHAGMQRVGPMMDDVESRGPLVLNQGVDWSRFYTAACFVPPIRPDPVEDESKKYSSRRFSDRR
jgi:hypothetical protein